MDYFDQLCSVYAPFMQSRKVARIHNCPRRLHKIMPAPTVCINNARIGSKPRPKGGKAQLHSEAQGCEWLVRIILLLLLTCHKVVALCKFLYPD